MSKIGAASSESEPEVPLYAAAAEVALPEVSLRAISDQEVLNSAGGSGDSRSFAEIIGNGGNINVRNEELRSVLSYICNRETSSAQEKESLVADLKFALSHPSFILNQAESSNEFKEEYEGALKDYKDNVEGEINLLIAKATYDNKAHIFQALIEHPVATNIAQKI